MRRQVQYQGNREQASEEDRWNSVHDRSFLLQVLNPSTSTAMTTARTTATSASAMVSMMSIGRLSSCAAARLRNSGCSRPACHKPFARAPRRSHGASRKQGSDESRIAARHAEHCRGQASPRHQRARWALLASSPACTACARLSAHGMRLRSNSRSNSTCGDRIIRPATSSDRAPLELTQTLARSP